MNCIYHADTCNHFLVFFSDENALKLNKACYFSSKRTLKSMNNTCKLYKKIHEKQRTKEKVNISFSSLEKEGER